MLIISSETRNVNDVTLYFELLEVFAAFLWPKVETTAPVKAASMLKTQQITTSS